MSHELQKWLPQQLEYTKTFDDEVDTDSEDQLGPLAVEEAIAAELFYHFVECPLSSHSRKILPIVVEHFPVETIPSGLEDLLNQILTRWAQSLIDQCQPNEEEATEISKEVLIFALANLHPTWVAEVEEPLFEVRYTIHMVGSTQITAKTPRQLDDQIEANYETMNGVNCDCESHDKEIVPLKDAARALLVQWERSNEEEKRNHG